MRFLPALPVGLADTKLIQFLSPLIDSLKNVLDSNTYRVTRVWTVPFDLRIPLAGARPRLQSPEIVRIGRAQVETDLKSVVGGWGPVTWEWIGDSQIRVLDAEGLVQGVNYRLIFEVVG